MKRLLISLAATGASMIGIQSGLILRLTSAYIKNTEAATSRSMAGLWQLSTDTLIIVRYRNY